MVSALPLDESQIARTAEEMIAEYGDEALTNADDRVKKLKSEGFDSIAKTWELIREVIKDVQKSDDKIRGYPPINSHPSRAERMNREDDDIEPLGAVEQALLDGWLNIEGPRGCHWIDDPGQYCNEPLAQLPSRSPYCEEHLRRSLTEAGWRRVLERAGRLRDPVDEPDRGEEDHTQVTHL